MLGSAILITITYFVLLIVPVFRGSVTDLSKFILSSTLFALFTFWLLRTLILKSYFSMRLYKLAPLLIFILICAVQIIPLPDPILKILSAKSFEYWDSSRTVLTNLNYKYGGNYFYVSIYPYISLSSLILLISYITYGIFISRFFQTRNKILIIMVPIFLATIIEGLIGIYQATVIYGITNSQGAHGTYVNRNHFAGFLELGIPLILGAVFSFSRKLQLRYEYSSKKVLSSENLFKQLLLIMILPVLFVSEILSKSRTGIFSLFISCIFFYIILSRNGFRLKNTKLLVSFMGLFLLCLLIYIGIVPLLSRFLNIGYDHRLYVWKDCINIIRDFPLMGSGLGTFEYIYPLYKYNVSKAVDYAFAHNDYIQLMVETGIAGFMAMMLTLFIFIRDISKFLRTNYENYDNFRYFTTLGAFTGVLSILIHSFTDFNLHIPANAVYFTTLIGIIYAVNSSEFKSNMRHSSSHRFDSRKYVISRD